MTITSAARMTGRSSSSMPICRAHTARSHTNACGRAGVRVCLRHFALRTRHPRALPLALASEAAAAQDAFWPFADAVYADQGRIDDPHLWAKAQELGLDVDPLRRRSPGRGRRERVARDVQDGLRAGVAQTPTLIVSGVLHGGVPTAEWLGRLH